MTDLTRYSDARRALAECVSVDVPLRVRAEMEHVKLHARHVQDRALMADATEIQMRAERRLGEILKAAEKEGLIREGRPKKQPQNGTAPVPFTLAEAGITKKLSAKSQQTASISERAFEAMVEHTRQRIASGAAIIIDGAAATAQKREARNNRERVLGECQQALPQKRYGVIVADPEWRFEPRSRETGMDRAADNHYPTSCAAVIAARDVPSISADDCVLFLWATAPMLPHALAVMAAWGFDYVSNYVWAKDKIGTGYWNRNQHEHLLIGTRGRVPAPAMGSQWSSLQSHPVAKHSAKPEAFLDMIETYFPTLPKIELNRRGPARRGWDAWGNESTAVIEGEASPLAATSPDESIDPETGEILKHAYPVITHDR